jgi:hypothetical protein
MSNPSQGWIREKSPNALLIVAMNMANKFGILPYEEPSTYTI